ncbi:preprotein translocase subunit SecA [Metabacillus crassostreae]|uniref:YecA family protein n=1 Tax=Metabacillus crassostreae TaxID=929098 RepID=UPI00195DB579|nr:SEC-C metal-binding domain-containing protein [Metabacillus crassostreae]MBM7606318.1 preprotein translocase subunit SecA [Metabacillus crassostreae]
MTFLEKVEPYILSDNELLRSFALSNINKSYLGTEKTFFLALEAMDKLPITPMVNKIIPYTSKIPFTETMLQEVLLRLEKDDGNKIWYLSMLDRCDTDLLFKYKDQLSPYINKEALDHYLSLLSMNSEQLFLEAATIMNQLEDEFNNPLFHFGKRVFKELIKHGVYSSENFWDIEAGIKSELENDYFSFNGIYNVFLAGEQKVESLVPTLSTLLDRVEEDFLLQEVETALIKIGNEEVLKEVEKHLQLVDTAYSAVEILANIKLPLAEEILLRQYKITKDKSIKTMIAEALLTQLSTKAIPQIVAFIEEGYNKGLLNLEEPLYACCIINKVDHPMLNQWEQRLIKEKENQEERSKEIHRRLASNTKVGRNDPCTCGSGKKFKKCCG